MANIHIARGETKLGNFPQPEVEAGLQSGRFLSTDLGWQDGMASWIPLAQFPGLVSTGLAVPPGEVPPIDPAWAAPALIPTGLPWDRRQELGIFPAFFGTLKLVLLSPSEAFSAMKPEGGLTEPLIFAIIGGSVGALVYVLLSVFVSSFGMMGENNPFAQLLGLGIGAAFLLLLIPIFLALGLFLGSAILHLCLMLVGGANRSFETTFRVVCFSIGSTYPLLIIPACGGLVSGIWCAVAECIGLARAHRTTTGRAVLAVFLPMIVCCGGAFFLGITFGLLGALSGNH